MCCFLEPVSYVVIVLVTLVALLLWDLCLRPSLGHHLTLTPAVWRLGSGCADRDAMRMEADVQHAHSRLTDLGLSTIVGLYALVMLLWQPLLKDCFRETSEEAVRFMSVAICIAIARHFYFCFRLLGQGRSVLTSLVHGLSGCCQLLFLAAPTLLVFSALFMTSELGNTFILLLAIVGERRLSLLPTWFPGLGVILSFIFNGLLYLLVVALALARRSPMELPAHHIAIFFFYIVYSFVLNAYSIYLTTSACISMLVEARVSWELRERQGTEPSALEMSGLSQQSLEDIRTALQEADRGKDAGVPGQPTVAVTEELLSKTPRQ